VAIAFHHPLFSAHDKRSINPARWDWWPAFEELGVDVVLTGHDHFYYRSWPIGRLGMQSSRGIPHITTAGGGAPLYKMKTRSYTAVEQSIHHISVLDIDGNSIQARVVDDSGRTIDEFEINKQPTPPSQFCAYEVYDLERAIRAELESRAPLILETDATTAVVQDELRVVHGFRVPVSARVSWDGDSASGAVVRLEPGEPLIIPISRRIALDPISKTGAAVAAARLPLVQLDFLDERFRNRRIEFSPLKFCKDLTVRAEALEGAPRMSQLLDGTALRRQKSIQFVRSDATQRAVIPVQMQTARFADRLAAVFTINGIRTNPVTELEAAPAVASDLLRTHHVRWVISNGMHTYAWAVNIDGGRAESKDGDWSFEEPDWSAFVRRRPSSCTIAVVLPMALLEGGDDLRINVVHVDPGTSVESCLSPTFDIGSDPDRIPDFRFGDRTVSRFARLMLP
jgi:hypothetical protein